ncbi:MAG: hypothetical protein M2R45_00080 [Verrucomicrobia subdivision 3 bacterium]|nr:hypothetical protein [Limisphaerales bacterium]
MNHASRTGHLNDPTRGILRKCCSALSIGGCFIGCTLSPFVRLPRWWWPFLGLAAEIGLIHIHGPGTQPLMIRLGCIAWCICIEIRSATFLFTFKSG